MTARRGRRAVVGALCALLMGARPPAPRDPAVGVAVIGPTGGTVTAGGPGTARIQSGEQPPDRFTGVLVSDLRRVIDR